jgi:site-specific recombinase XerD
MSDLIKYNFDLEEVKSVFDLIDVGEETRDDYKKRIGLFLSFIQEKGFDFNSYLNFKRMLADMSEYSVSTKNKYLISAKIFLKELSKRGKIPVDITMNIKGFIQGKKHKKEGLNGEEMTILFDNLSGKESNKKLDKIKSIIALLTFQGLRQIEIIRLDVSDIDLVGKIAFVRGKGKDDKEKIFLHNNTIKILKKYIKSNSRKSGALFVSDSNNSKNKRMTTRGLRGIVKTLLDSLEIEKSTHSFRHYFTTTLIQNLKGDLLEVMKFTRHKNIEMLQVYNDNIEIKKTLPMYNRAFNSLNFKD